MPMSKILQFIKEVRETAKQISWPKRDTLIQLTVVVISISVILAAALGGLDFIFVNTIGLVAKQKYQPVAAPQPTEVTTPSPVASPSAKPKK